MLAAVFLTVAPGEKNAYVFTSPSFESKEICVQYVENNLNSLVYKLNKDIPQYTPQQFYCASEEMLEKFFNEHPQGTMT